MSGLGQPEAISRDDARVIVTAWRMDDTIQVVSMISPVRDRDYALRTLWTTAVQDINLALPVLWADDQAREYGLISWRT